MSRAIDYFLIGGTPNGRIEVSIRDRVAVVYKIPRVDLPKCKDMSRLKQSGIYFLVGKDGEDNDAIYVGQAGLRKIKDGLYIRLSEHNKEDDDFYTYIIAITSSKNDLGATDITYLEHYFYNAAKDIRRYRPTNKNDPSEGHVTPFEKAFLDEFADDVKVLVGTLGCQAFIPLDDKKADKVAAPELSMTYSGFQAKGRVASDGFVILKGSQVNPNVTPTCPDRTKSDREKYKDLIDKSSNQTTANILLSSSSSAASFVGGASLSGPIYWKNGNGQTLKELQEIEK